MISCVQAAEVAQRCQEPVAAVLRQALEGHLLEQQMQAEAEEAADRQSWED